MTHTELLLCLLQVFDVQRKVTYKNLGTWYTELREFRPEIPCVVVANKIDGRATPGSGVSNSRGPTTGFFQFSRAMSLQ